MAASSVSRERYREYVHFLRVSADNLNMSVAPARLRRLRSQVSVERNKFLVWEVAWILIALFSLVPVMMLVATEFNLPLPASIAARAEAFHFQVTSLESALAVTGVIVSGILFPTALGIACAPIIANSDAIADLEHAHRTLKAIEKE